MRLSWLLILPAVVGCGTTRTTDTQRAATEMLLVSQAVDHAVSQVDGSPLAGKLVFLDTQYLDGTVDKGYVISSLRQHLLAHGALLMDERGRSDYVVEVRSGGVGTDRSGLLIGTPSMTIPAVPGGAGLPTSVPEIALIKKTDQKGVAKLAVFAYQRQTGRPVWQSGLVAGSSTLKDKWYFGAGPYSTGTVKPDGEFAGERLPHLPLPFVNRDTGPDEPAPVLPAAAVQQSHVYPTPGPPPRPLALLGLGGGLTNLPTPDNPPGVVARGSVSAGGR